MSGKEEERKERTKEEANKGGNETITRIKKQLHNTSITPVQITKHTQTGTHIHRSGAPTHSASHLLIHNPTPTTMHSHSQSFKRSSTSLHPLKRPRAEHSRIHPSTRSLIHMSHQEQLPSPGHSLTTPPLTTGAAEDRAAGEKDRSSGHDLQPFGAQAHVFNKTFLRVVGIAMVVVSSFFCTMLVVARGEWIA